MKPDIEALIHPVRMRIIGALAMFGPHTPSELKKKLDNIPQATLYRNIQFLRDRGILTIADSKTVRGNTEYTYQLNYDKSTIKPEDLSKLSAEDHHLLFLQYTAILHEYHRSYIEQLPPNQNSQATMSIAPLYLSDEEFKELENELQTLILSKTGKSEAKDRKQRLLSLVLLPGIHIEEGTE